MIPTRAFRVWAGNSGTVENPAGIEIVLKAGTPPAPVDLTGSEIVFRAVLGSGVIRKTSANGGITIVELEGRITVPITVADSRLMTAGDRWRYEIERRIGGSERTIICGELIAAGGANDDAG